MTEPSLDAALRRIAELEARLASLEQQLSDASRGAGAPASTDRARDERQTERAGVSRRQALRALTAGTAVAGAGAALGLLAAAPAAAAPGDALVLGQDNDAGSSETGLSSTGNTLRVSTVSGTALLATATDGTAIHVESEHNPAVVISSVGYQQGPAVDISSVGGPSIKVFAYGTGVESASEGSFGVLARGFPAVRAENGWVGSAAELASRDVGVIAEGPSLPSELVQSSTGLRATGDVGVDATGVSAALKTTGPLRFDRSGVAIVPRGALFVTVPVPGTRTTQLGPNTKVLATTQTGGIPVRFAAVASPTRIRIVLNGVATSPTPVAWLVLD